MLLLLVAKIIALFALFIIGLVFIIYMLPYIIVASVQLLGLPIMIFSDMGNMICAFVIMVMILAGIFCVSVKYFVVSILAIVSVLILYLFFAPLIIFGFIEFALNDFIYYMGLFYTYAYVVGIMYFFSSCTPFYYWIATTVFLCGCLVTDRYLSKK